MFHMWTHKRAPTDLNPTRRAVLCDGVVIGHVFWGMQGKRGTWFWEIDDGFHGVAKDMAQALENLRRAHLYSLEQNVPRT